MLKHLFIVVVVIGTFAAAPALGHAGELAIIINNANPTASLSKDEVRSYYLKKQTGWSNGEKLRPVDLESDAAHREPFVHKLLGMSNDDLERYWLELKYQKAESPPKRVADDAAVIKFVAAFKGGIGFVDAASLDADAKTKVKVAFTLKY